MYENTYNQFMIHSVATRTFPSLGTLTGFFKASLPNRVIQHYGPETLVDAMCFQNRPSFHTNRYHMSYLLNVWFQLTLCVLIAWEEA